VQGLKKKELNKNFKRYSLTGKIFFPVFYLCFVLIVIRGFIRPK